MSQTKPISEELKPILENGDRLSRPEFERRYNQLPHIKKAELVEGFVYIARISAVCGKFTVWHYAQISSQN